MRPIPMRCGANWLLLVRRTASCLRSCCTPNAGGKVAQYAKSLPVDPPDGNTRPATTGTARPPATACPVADAAGAFGAARRGARDSRSCRLRCWSGRCSRRSSAGVNGATVRPKRSVFIAAQAIVGCLIAELDRARDLRLILRGVAAVPRHRRWRRSWRRSFLGYLISRWKVLPGTTAVWGSTPGAASAMVLMADAFGADARLVAFMQYLRVIFVSIAAARDRPALGRYVGRRSAARSSGSRRSTGRPSPRRSPLPRSARAAGRADAASCRHLPRADDPGHRAASRRRRPLQLPQWLLAVSYAVIGWSIGLNFTRTILLHAARALPQIIASIVALIAFCAALGFAMSRMLGIDPLTAYLATSPGGMDSVAIIAAASNQRRHLLRHGAADRALPDRAARRTAAGAAACAPRRQTETLHPRQRVHSRVRLC